MRQEREERKSKRATKRLPGRQEKDNGGQEGGWAGVRKVINCIEDVLLGWRIIVAAAAVFYEDEKKFIGQSCFGSTSEVDAFSLKKNYVKTFSFWRLTSLHLFGHRVSVHPLQQEQQADGSMQWIEGRKALGSIPGIAPLSPRLLPATSTMRWSKVTQGDSIQPKKMTLS